MNIQNNINKYYKRNVFGITSAEVFWGLGLPVVFESTFLQLFLKNLGASSFIIGLIPSFFFIGISVFALYGDYFTANKPYKRRAVVAFHAVSGCSLLVFGVALFIFGKATYVLIVFIICYAIFSICVGMTVPVWQNYLVKIFSEEKTVSALSIMMIGQNVTKLISSFFIVKLIDRYSFSINSSAVVFIGVGGLFVVGGLFFLITREGKLDADYIQVQREPFLIHTTKAIKKIIKNKNLLWFLVGNIDSSVLVSVMAFYANYATIYCDIDPAIAGGVFVGCIYCGAISANLLFGMLGSFSLKTKYIIAKIFAGSAVILLILFGQYWSFFLASFLIGLSRGIRSITYPPTVKKLSGLEDSTSYFAVIPLLTMPFAVSLPLVYGKSLDIFSYLNGNEYRAVFMASVLIIILALFCILKTDFNKT